MLKSILSERNLAWLLGLSILLAAVVRSPQIYGDPPAGDVSRSGDFISDEGTGSSNALQWILTGEWHTPDALNTAVNGPIFTLFEIGMMKVFGANLAAVRCGGILSGLITLLLLYFLIAQFDKVAALLALFFGAFNFALIVYNRLAFFENLLLVWLIGLGLLTVAIVRRPDNHKLVVAFWLVFALAYLTKALVIFFVPLFVIMTFRVDARSRKRIWGISAICIITFASLVWLLWFSRYVEDWRYYQQVNVGDRLDLNPIAIALNYARYLFHLKFFEFMPVQYTIALLMVARGIHHIVLRKEISLIEQLFIFWLLLGSLQLGFSAYSPGRYSLILLPPILALNGLFFSQLRGPAPAESKPWPGILLAMVMAIGFLQISFGFYRLHSGQFYPSCFLPLLAPIPAIMIWLFSKEKLSKAATVWGLAGLIIAIQSFQVIRFHVNMEFSLYSALKDVAAILRDGNGSEKVVLAGDLAPMVAFVAHVPVIDITYRRELVPQRVREMQPKYLFLEDGDEGLARLREQMPEYWDSFRPLKRYRILNNYRSGRDAVLYGLIEHPRP
jgi:4-amino-4-deoxy-L-arabinose transferase-like glycosyltransferase